MKLGQLSALSTIGFYKITTYDWRFVDPPWTLIKLYKSYHVVPEDLVYPLFQMDSWLARGWLNASGEQISPEILLTGKNKFLRILAKLYLKRDYLKFNQILKEAYVERKSDTILFGG